MAIPEDDWREAYRNHVMTVRSPDGMTQLPMVPQFRMDEVLDLLHELERQFDKAPLIRRAVVVRGVKMVENDRMIGLSEIDFERIRRLLRVNGRI